MSNRLATSVGAVTLELGIVPPQITPVPPAIEGRRAMQWRFWTESPIVPEAFVYRPSPSPRTNEMEMPRPLAMRLEHAHSALLSVPRSKAKPRPNVYPAREFAGADKY